MKTRNVINKILYRDATEPDLPFLLIIVILPAYFISQGDIHYGSGDFEKFYGPTKTSARTLSYVIGSSWNYPITDADKLGVGNCFPGRCWGVPYIIGSFNDRGKELIADTMKEIEMDTCVR